jgi:peptidoglycan/xylan/chitin deacetylase (PgdA/CDA1 family)
MKRPVRGRGSGEVRVWVKRGVELGLCRSGLTRLARRFRRQDVLVLAYHNVVPEGVEVRGERSLHVGQERLHRQLGVLARTHDFIPVDGIAEAATGRPRVAITFDDAYRGAVQLGGEVLSDLGIPATVFVAPAWLGGRRFWWDVLSHDRELEPGVRKHALDALKGKAPEVLEWAARDTDPAGHVSPHTVTATEAELEGALAHGGLTLGSHSWSHPNLAALDGPELEEELDRPVAWLRDRWPERTVEWLSYPYGRWSPRVVEAARRAGYRGAFRIDGGWIRDGVSTFETPRLNIPAGLSLEGLELRASGLWGS